MNRGDSHVFRFLPLIGVGFGMFYGLGSLTGCDADTPRVPTPEQVLRADAASQDAMRQHYGNTRRHQSKPRSQSDASLTRP